MRKIILSLGVALMANCLQAAAEEATDVTEADAGVATFRVASRVLTEADISARIEEVDLYKYYSLIHTNYLDKFRKVDFSDIFANVESTPLVLPAALRAPVDFTRFMVPENWFQVAQAGGAPLLLAQPAAAAAEDHAAPLIGDDADLPRAVPAIELTTITAPAPAEVGSSS